jgi:hypothetical protein
LQFSLYFGLCEGLFGGLILGLFCGLGVGSLNHITLVETFSWNWNQFWKRTIFGSIGGLSVGLIFGLSVGLIYALFGVFSGQSDALAWLTSGLSIGLESGLILAFICGLISGLIGGFIDRVKVGKAFPNQGIKLSRKNALPAFLVSSLIFSLIFSLMKVLDVARQKGVILGMVLDAGLLFGLIVGLNRGGSAVIKHYALRLILWLKDYTPLNFIKFLDHCAKLIFLKKVGGGYIFIHRMLLEYFADLPAIERSGESKRT